MKTFSRRFLLQCLIGLLVCNPVFATTYTYRIYSKSMKVSSPASGHVYATFDPNAKGPNVTLSNENMTATFSGMSTVMAKLTQPMAANTGSYYWEVLLEGNGGGKHGIATAAVDLTRNLPLSASSYVFTSGGSFDEGTQLTSCSGQVLTAGMTLGFFFDTGASQLTVYINDVPQCTKAIPAGTYYPVSSAGAAGFTFTLVTGGASYINSMPAGTQIPY